jgi:tetratricopeptide (TPR) repeat protein
VAQMNSKLKSISTNIALVILATLAFGACKEAEVKAVETVTTDSVHQVSGERISEELAALNQKIKSSPTNPGFYNERAGYYLKHKEYDLAYEDLRFGFTIDSVNMSLFSTMADYHILKSEPGLAKAALEKALSINPKSVQTYVKLGEVYYLARKYDNAFKSINDGLKIDKYYADGYFWKGMIYKDKGDIALAMSNFQTSVEQNPDNYKAYMQLGLLALEERKPAAAEYFSSAIRLQPRSIEAWYGRGYFYQLTNEYDKAIKDYTAILEIDPSYASAHYNLGIVHYALRVIDEAYKNFDRAIKYNNRYAEAYYMRGLCEEAKGKDEAALADFEYSLSLRPDYQLALMGIERVKGTLKSIQK